MYQYVGLVTEHDCQIILYYAYGEFREWYVSLYWKFL